MSNVSTIFSRNNNVHAFSFDGENFASAGSSKWSHAMTFKFGNFKDKAFTVGCDNSWSNHPCGKKTELMDMETLEWSNEYPDYPFAS